MRRSLIVGLLALGLLLPAPAAAEETYSPEALRIANALNCPVCEGQSVRDSNSQLARQMRGVIQQKLDEGYTRQEIFDYFVESYGISVLREPPKSGFALVLWWTPIVGLLVGAAILGTFIFGRRGRGPGGARSAEAPVGPSAPDIARYEEMLRRDLSARRRSSR